MNDLMISFYLKWRNGAEDLIRQFKDCQTEEDLLEIIKDNMIISIPINNERLITTNKLNEQQEIIKELERKLKKYEKIGEEQLKQIIELQDELKEYKTKPKLDTDNCGYCKHFQIDGMFGIWCEKDHNWTLVNENCSDFER